MANRWGNIGNSDGLYILGPPNHCDGDCNHEIKRHLVPWNKSYDQPRQHIKKPDTSFCQQSSTQSKLWFFQYPYSSHIWM